MTGIGDSGTTATQSPPPQPPMDWGRGQYEQTATALFPAAEAVVRAARLLPGQRTLDVGCGTSNVALIAAWAGVHVTRVDPAVRSFEVARVLARSEGLRVQLFSGEASSLPLPDRCFDTVLSNSP